MIDCSKSFKKTQTGSTSKCNQCYTHLGVRKDFIFIVLLLEHSATFSTKYTPLSNSFITAMW